MYEYTIGEIESLIIPHMLRFLDQFPYPSVALGCDERKYEVFDIGVVPVNHCSDTILTQVKTKIDTDLIVICVRSYNRDAYRWGQTRYGDPAHKSLQPR